jgi:hypothetical protein
MKWLFDFLSFLYEAGLTNAAFIIGSLAVIVAIVGQLGKDWSIVPRRGFLLGLFGFLLLTISVSGTLVGKAEQPIPEPMPSPEKTPTASHGAARTPPDRTETADLPYPLREHYTVTVGEGVLAQGTFSDGLAPYTEDWLWENGRFRIQVINPHSFPGTGCDVSRHNTDLIWIGGSPGMQFTINGEVLGTYEIAPEAHGYIFHAAIQTGDVLCVTNTSPAGYHVILGPDIYYHYDSYCFRGNC